jgi:hypothetical protein
MHLSGTVAPENDLVRLHILIEVVRIVPVPIHLSHRRRDRHPVHRGDIDDTVPIGAVEGPGTTITHEDVKGLPTGEEMDREEKKTFEGPLNVPQLSVSTRTI